MDNSALNNAAIRWLLAESEVPYSTNASSTSSASTRMSSTEEFSYNTSTSVKHSLLAQSDNNESFKKTDAAIVCTESSEDIRLQKLPRKLFSMLSDAKINHIISWMPHGRAWKIRKKKEFIEDVLPQYFEYTNYNSFVRLVNAWGFRRITSGLDANAYYHELFLRGMPLLHNKMHRLKKNQKKESSPSKSTPDFYAMDKISPLPPLDNSEAPVDKTSRRLSLTRPSIGMAALNHNGAKALSPLNQVSQLPSLPTVGVNRPSMNRVALNHSEANELSLLSQAPQMSPLLTAGPNQLGNAQLASYLLNRQQGQQLGQLALPLNHVFNHDTLIANQIFAEQQRQMSLSLPTNLYNNFFLSRSEAIASVGRVPSANTVENALLNVSNLQGRNSASNITENVLLNDSNAIAALDFLKSLQQQGLPSISRSDCANVFPASRR
mmetsp:Transcript_61478/g.91379  ORF Transcript_61478/g.91379 Transcript_61478/m.91379 type:complete len:436 (+) Transcript_61478:209-1516(+)